MIEGAAATAAADVSRAPAIQVERLVAGGEALAHHADGRVMFVRGALPGEVVDVELSQVKRDWVRGTAVAVVSASPSRVVPPCERRRAGCGGCDWQHLAVPAQLPAKAEVVVESLRRTARLGSATVVIGGSVPAEGYRTTVRLVGTAAGRPGFRVEQSHDTVEATGCLVAHPRLRDVVAALRVPDGVEVSLRVSDATGEITALWDARRGEVEGLPAGATTGPDASLHEVVAGHRLRVSAASFFQSGRAAAELLVDAVRRAAPELATADRVADLYGGIGLFAVAAVPPSARVTVVESSRSAVADATVNLADRAADRAADRRAEVVRAEVVRAEVGAWSPATADRLDVVIADPARTGLGRPGVAAVARTRAPVVVVVSCDPVALARDATLLASHGYRHEVTEVLDLFPHTHHVEAVTRFTAAQVEEVA